MNLGEVFITGMKDNLTRKRRIIAIIVISMIPMLYTWFYLKAFWDPYKNISNLPLAFVNEDNGNYGQDLMNYLQNNTDVSWNFVDRETANIGLRNKTTAVRFR